MHYYIAFSSYNYVGQKSSKTASSVSRTSKGYGASVAKQAPAVVTCNFRTQCKPKLKQYQEQKHQHQQQPPNIGSIQRDENKIATRQSTTYKSPFRRYSNLPKASPNADITTMEAGYNLRGTTNKQKHYYHPSLPSIGGPGSSRVRVKDVKEKNKASKYNGK